MTAENVTLTHQAFSKSVTTIETLRGIISLQLSLKKNNVNVVIFDLCGFHQISQKHRQEELPSRQISNGFLGQGSV